PTITPTLFLTNAPVPTQAPTLAPTSISSSNQNSSNNFSSAYSSQPIASFYPSEAPALFSRIKTTENLDLKNEDENKNKQQILGEKTEKTNNQKNHKVIYLFLIIIGGIFLFLIGKKIKNHRIISS
ncbi:MAG: hypothetical protein N2593_02285, partial [Patescibacteria group bacterium]|nr:hypothetical protein [Patescibacteria group bacterium]